MNRLIFRPPQWAELRSRLLSTAPLESAAALIVSRGTSNGSNRLLVREILYPQSDDYLDQTELRVSLAPAFVARSLKAARATGATLILAHSHPGLDDAMFSVTDENAILLLAPTMHRRSAATFHGAAVIANKEFRVSLFDQEGTQIGEVERVLEIGPSVLLHDSKEAPAELMPDFYDRNVRAFGKEGQERLAKLKVGIVGVGGTGSIVVEELARLGIGQLLLVDPEPVETTNLNRLLSAQACDVGRLKVDVAGDAAARARSDIGVTKVANSILFENVARLLLDCDFVFCCTDSHGSRAVLNQMAYQYGIPMIDIGIRIDAVQERVQSITTRVQMLSPGLPCLNCHPLLNPVAIRQDLLEDRSVDPYIVGFHEPQPAVISINAAASSSAVTMFLSATVGLPGRARHLVGRPIEGTVRAVVGNSNPDCIVCAPANALLKGDAWPMIWRKQ